MPTPAGARRPGAGGRISARRGREATRVELAIHALAAGGDGIGRTSDGRVVFVPFTAPGDRVRVRLTEERARFARGVVDTLLETGPHRVDPVCAVYGSCGGCAWQHVAYEAQLEAKAEIVADAFARLGGLPLADPVPITPSPEPYGYRTRARVRVENGRVGFRRRRSHALCETSRCPVLTPALREELAALAARPPRVDGEWELSAGADSARSHALGAAGGPSLRLSVGGVPLSVSPGVFVQANGLLLDAIAEGVGNAAGRGGLCLELFAGAGFLTVGLARRFDQVVALEANPVAVADLERNLEAAGAGHVRILSDRLEDALARSAFGDLRPDVVVLDPPRTGLPKGGAEALAALGSERIAYLSCDPATLARDARVLVEEGFRLTGVEAFDLFPQTPHVEALASFRRRFG